MAIDGHDVSGELGADLAVRTHTKGAHLIVKGSGVVDELGLVHQPGDRLEHRGGHFDTHAQVNRVALLREAQLCGNRPQPGGALPSRGHDDRPGSDLFSTLRL